MTFFFFFTEKLLPYASGGGGNPNSEKLGIAWVLAKGPWLVGSVRQKLFHRSQKKEPGEPGLWSGDTQLVQAGTHGGILSSPGSE